METWALDPREHGVSWPLVGVRQVVSDSWVGLWSLDLTGLGVGSSGLTMWLGMCCFAALV